MASVSSKDDFVEFRFLCSTEDCIKISKCDLRIYRISCIVTTNSLIHLIKTFDKNKWKKFPTSKKSRTLILHNNNAEKLLNIGKQKICVINNQVTYLFFHVKWIYWLFRIHINFFNFFYVFQNNVFQKKLRL